ncbi:ABC transporter substrate-binding protein [Haladaptatus sp. AB643]|uniref:ABC transporter substrate-binding protein n=1 Tax=Haladaptatus sp. AB643 TaxID=2934174 RepID=UPI00209C2349|nr:ABC transporter substrate-binding protein [Haladaptatus sp. AB643]MCO8244236.1 ABC transporter substrate-binding protein [Haladaptatus sp. AB643]
MRVREFPVLGEADRSVVDRLACGIGEPAATVLAYLLCRREEFTTEPASLLAVRIGTGSNRKAVRNALAELTERELIEATTVRDETPGRPATRWRATGSVEETVEAVYDEHANELLARVGAFPNRPESNAVAELDSTVPDAPISHATNASFSLALNWRPNGLHAPLFVADETGLYEKWGLSVRFDAHEGSRAALDGIVSDTADIAVSGAATVLRARAEGEQIVPVALLFQHAMTAIYGLRTTFDGPLERAEQLRGLRIGMPSTAETGLLGRLFLSQGGVLNDVEIVDLRGEERAALLSGAVDAVTGSFSDPRKLRDDGISVESIPVAERFPLPGPAIVTSERTLSEREPELAAFLAATTAGWTTARQNPSRVEEAVEAHDDAEPSSPSRERRTFEAAVEEFGTTDAVRNFGWGWGEAELWNRLATALDGVGSLGSEGTER